MVGKLAGLMRRYGATIYLNLLKGRPCRKTKLVGAILDEPCPTCRIKAAR
jgi:hypothetical protein